MKIANEHSHRFARQITQQTPALAELVGELISAIEGISDEDILKAHLDLFSTSKSISKSINHLLRERLVPMGWTKESKIFKGEQFQKENSWALDFSKSINVLVSPSADADYVIPQPVGVAVEVAFNHGEAAAWNILKPVLAAELNHVEKETHIGEGIGALIVVSAEMEDKGGFDGAVGNYDRYMKHLSVMRNQVSVPMLIISLAAPQTFFMERFPKNHPDKNKRGRSTGVIKRI